MWLERETGFEPATSCLEDIRAIVGVRSEWQRYAILCSYGVFRSAVVADNGR
jgi:hypothetical protein